MPDAPAVEDDPAGNAAPVIPGPTARIRLCGAVCLAACAAPAQAQGSPEPAARIMAGVDVTFATRYVWRGLLRSDVPVFQPAAWIGVARGRYLLSAGAWSTFEPGEPDAAEISLASDPGEIEAWFELAARSSHVDASLGFIARDGRHARPLGHLPPGFDTRELRVRAVLRDGALRRSLHLTPSALVAWDVGEIGGRYYEADLEYAATLIPEPRAVPFATLFLGVTAAWSDGMAAGGAARHAYFTEDGLTHWEARALVSMVPSAKLPLVLHLLRRDRFARDPAVRRVSTDPLARSRTHVGWWELTASVRGSLSVR